MLKRELWHKSLTDEFIMEARFDENNPGFCLICGEKTIGIDPDAKNYKCESCGAEQVFDLRWLMMEII